MSTPKKPTMSRRAGSRKSALPRPPLPRPGQLSTLYDDMLSLPNVKGCYIGFKRTAGRMIREVSLVVCVVEKVDKRTIGRSGRVPPKLGWQATSRRTDTIPTDVRVVGESVLQAPVLGAGDGIEGVAVPGDPFRPAEGTIGAAMLHPVFGRVVTTAGHVLGVRVRKTTTFPAGEEPRVALRNAGTGPVVIGLARKVSITSNGDYALISPPDGLAVENLYRDLQPLAPPFAPGPGDIHKRVFVMARRELLPTRLTGIHGYLPIGPFLLRDLLLTDVRTIGGDSGGCLVNAQSRVLGFVEGVTMLDGVLVSAYTSSVWPFRLENGIFF